PAKRIRWSAPTGTAPSSSTACTKWSKSPRHCVNISKQREAPEEPLRASFGRRVLLWEEDRWPCHRKHLVHVLLCALRHIGLCAKASRIRCVRAYGARRQTLAVPPSIRPADNGKHKCSPQFA